MTLAQPAETPQRLEAVPSVPDAEVIHQGRAADADAVLRLALTRARRQVSRVDNRHRPVRERP